MSVPKNVEIVPYGDPRRPKWIPQKNDQGYPLNVYVDEGCWREARWGRYVLPSYDPTKKDGHDGIGKTWQRATTFISMAEYQGEGLMDYGVRNALGGLVISPQLLVHAAILMEREGLPDKHRMDKETADSIKAEWKALADLAQDAAGANEASEKGTEIHAAIEWVNKGGTVETLPVQTFDHGEIDLSVWSRHVEAYLDLKERAGFEVFPELVERVVNPDGDGTSGKFDLLVLWQAPDKLIDDLNAQRKKDGDPVLAYWTEPRYVVTDAKSGDTEYRDKMGRQLLRYARAEALWDFDRDVYEDAPEDVCQEFGLVISIPWWEEDPIAELLPIPFGKVAEDGLDACRTVGRSRKLRSPKMRYLAQGAAPKIEAPEPDPVAPARGFRARPSVLDKALEAVAADNDPLHVDILDQVTEFDGTGGPLGPLAGEGERGCSVCHRKGHKKGSPKCLGQSDPALKAEASHVANEEASDDAYPDQAGVQEREDNPPTETHGDELWCQAPGRSGWTAPEVEGAMWVCGDCGKLSKAGILDGSGQPLAVSASGYRTHPDGFPGAAELAAERVVVAPADDPWAAGPGSPASIVKEEYSDTNEMTEEEYWVSLIETAPTRAEVIGFGKSALKKLGVDELTPALKAAGKKRLAEVS